MKHFKTMYYLLFIAVILVSCEKETITLLENSESSIQSSLKGNLSARSLDIPAGDLYALAPWDSSNNIALYNYNPTTDEIILNSDFTGSTGIANNYGFDFNYRDGLIYLLADRPGEGRYLYTYNKNTDASTLIRQIVSVGVNGLPQDLTFGNDGTLYFVFKNGEVNAYNITSQSMSAFSTVLSGGSVGLTYDYDNNQLIYALGNSPVRLFSIDIPTGLVTEMFSYDTPVFSGYNGQAIEYVGNDKLIASGTFGSNIIYTIDLATEETNLLLHPTGSYSSIKDLMFVNNTDFDGDGVLNENDAHPNSDMSEFINIGGCYPNVKNVLVKNGSTMMDQIEDLIAQINLQYNGDNYKELHEEFVKKVAGLTYYWKRDRQITSKQRTAISSCAWRANIPFWEEI
ncbi:hypothetical protein [Lutibacter sp.]|uniref:hypothetical protein n=1 Tax=Lutibacter sp. TaxID=1925666 RepID=UPI00273236DF|nr:hypothetical protein [Lutibacter sp.]MDP3313299.1 hypothetical protein [Lutibacter sp.]